MNLSEDQKRIAKSAAMLSTCYIIVTVLYHVIRGNAEWLDILWQSVAVIVVSILIALFFVIGSKTPEK